MIIQRKAFKKWLFITALCGAHSFFWGVMTNGNPLAMILGILTIATLFALIESHPRYQARRSAAPRLARALDWGVKFRCRLAVYILLSAIVFDMFDSLLGWAKGIQILYTPYLGEMLIGYGSLMLTKMLTGFTVAVRSTYQMLPGIENFVATYLTTIFTAIAHTVILAIICVLGYGVMRLRQCMKQVKTDGETTS